MVVLLSTHHLPLAEASHHFCVADIALSSLHLPLWESIGHPPADLTFPLNSVYCTQGVHSTMYTVHRGCTLLCILYTGGALYYVYCTVYTPLCSLYSVDGMYSWPGFATTVKSAANTVKIWLKVRIAAASQEHQSLDSGLTNFSFITRDRRVSH